MKTGCSFLKNRGMIRPKNRHLKFPGIKGVKTQWESGIKRCLGGGFSDKESSPHVLNSSIPVRVL